MSEPGLPVPSAAGWAQEWQRFSHSAADQAMAHYLRGCANVAMAHTLPEAWAQLFAAQNILIRNSAGALAEALELWRKQSNERPRS